MWYCVDVCAVACGYVSIYLVHNVPYPEVWLLPNKQSSGRHSHESGDFS